MKPDEIKQRLGHWARQTVIFATLYREDFDGSLFESAEHVQRASEKAKSVVDGLWQEALREATLEKLAVHFVGKILTWVKNDDDLTVHTL